MRKHQHRRQLDPAEVTPVLAAHASLCVSGGSAQLPAGLEPITQTQQRLDRTALTWLELRLTP